MSLFARLPNDISIEILNEWIGVREYGLLDAAFCSHSLRSQLLMVFSYVFWVGHLSPTSALWIQSRGLKLKRLSLADDWFDEKCFKVSFDFSYVTSIFLLITNESFIEASLEIINLCDKAETFSSYLCQDDFVLVLNGLTNLESLLHFQHSQRGSRSSVDSLEIIANRCRELLSFEYMRGSYNAEPYIPVLMNNPNLTSLHLTGVMPLTVIQIYCPKIKHVKLEGEWNMSEALSFIKQSTTIQRISLGEVGTASLVYDKSGDQKYLKLASFLDNLSNNDIINCIEQLKDLTTVKFEYMNIPINFIKNNYQSLESLSCYAVTNELEEILVRCAKLRELTIESNSSAGMAAVFSQFTNYSLKKFRIFWSSSWTVFDVFAVLKCCVNIMEVSFEIFAPSNDDLDDFKLLLTTLHNFDTIQCTVHYIEDFNEYYINLIDGKFSETKYEADSL